jgi:hypothetical protein
MAKDARMLHLSISKSLQVDSLPLPARLLFTWMIAHADDDGRIKGEPKYIKGSVVPLTNWSTKNIQKYLELMKKIGLIYYWQENDQWFVEFVKWNMYQHIRSDRYKTSDLPSFHKSNDNQVSTRQQPHDNQEEPEANISESNPNEFNKSETKDEEPIAVKNLPYKGSSGNSEDNYQTSGNIQTSDKKSLKRAFDPHSFEPQNESEYAAKEVWLQTEPNNPSAFYTTYLYKIKKGLPPTKLYQFSSEIKQDPTIENPGAVMNKKIQDWFESQNKIQP